MHSLQEVTGNLKLHLLPLQQVFWWWQDSLIYSLKTARLHCLQVRTTVWTVLSKRFKGTCNMTSSLAGCLHSVYREMPHVCDVRHLLRVDSVVGALAEASRR